MLFLTFSRHTVIWLFCVTLTMLILTGCANKVKKITVNIPNDAIASSDYYLQQGQQSRVEDRDNWQLLAIRALLLEGNNHQAAEQLATLSRNLDNFQSHEKQLLEAELQLAQTNDAAARDRMATLHPASLSTNQQVRYWRMQISMHQNQPTVELIRAYIAWQLLPINLGKEEQENIDKIWQAITQLSPQDLKTTTIDADEHLLEGWLDLGHSWQNSRQNPDSLKAAIKSWQARYPQHPVAGRLPTPLNQISTAQESGKIIGLLLPLNGSAKAFGEAIQQGFIAAKNGLSMDALPPADIPDNSDNTATLSPDSAIPGTAISKPAANIEIKIYDTSTQPINTLLTKAQRDGVSLVVGPLLKSDVAQLANITTSLSILALNQPETVNSHPGICYFALSPEDEAHNAAQHIWQQQKKLPLLLLPRGTFGTRIASAFTEQWQNQGGMTVLKQTFGSISELKQAINNNTGIRMAGIPVLTPADQPPASVNGNIDAVYIVATPDELSLIKPMIDMASEYHDRPALFASSRSHQAGTGSDYYLEMEGIQFSDIPFMSDTNSTLRQQAAVAMNNDYSLIRLYAMGMDAWILAEHFANIQHAAFHIPGLTGILGVSPGCIIQRKLSWLQYRNGTIIPVTS